MVIDQNGFQIWKEPWPTNREPVQSMAAPIPIEPHVQNFLDCVKSREKPVADVEIGFKTITACHLGVIAYKVKREIQWDAQQEIFPGDDEANQYLDVPKRKPYELPSTV